MLRVWMVENSNNSFVTNAGWLILFSQQTLMQWMLYLCHERERRGGGWSANPNLKRCKWGGLSHALGVFLWAITLLIDQVLGTMALSTGGSWSWWVTGWYGGVRCSMRWASWIQFEDGGCLWRARPCDLQYMVQSPVGCWRQCCLV